MNKRTKIARIYCRVSTLYIDLIQQAVAQLIVKSWLR